MKDINEHFNTIRAWILDHSADKGAAYGAGFQVGIAFVRHENCPQSEPERIMGIALRAVGIVSVYPEALSDHCPGEHNDSWLGREDSPLAICCQHPVDRFRSDLMVWGNQNIAVEVDGHDFHERTKAQAQHDKSRDRIFQQLGYLVFRYTGSEVWSDPINCAKEVINAALGGVVKE